MVCMAYRRRNKTVVARTYRIYKPLSDALDIYADQQDLSSNAALNKLLKIALENVGIDYESLENSSEEATK